MAHQAQSQSQLAKFVKGGLFDGGIQAQHLCRGQHAQLLADVGVQQLQGCRVAGLELFPYQGRVCGRSLASALTDRDKVARRPESGVLVWVCVEFQQPQGTCVQHARKKAVQGADADGHLQTV